VGNLIARKGLDVLLATLAPAAPGGLAFDGGWQYGR
jgi:hypothetical protein